MKNGKILKSDCIGELKGLPPRVVQEMMRQAKLQCFKNRRLWCAEDCLRAFQHDRSAGIYGRGFCWSESQQQSKPSSFWCRVVNNHRIGLFDKWASHKNRRKFMKKK